VSDIKRCEECGSWDAECSSDVPVEGCCCVRCARYRIAKLEEKYEKLREALEQVVVDINDPHPRNSSLEGFLKSMRSTEKMITKVFEETK